MATKKEVLEAALRGEGCLGRAKDDEPVFVLVGDDMLAVGAIQYWMHRLEMHRRSGAKVEQANEVVQEFLVWAGKNGTKVPD
jgi:hypothetical protein